MLYAGIAWTPTGFEVAAVDAVGESVLPAAHFAPERTDELIAHLRRLNAGAAAGGAGGAVVAVESTNGILDGRLMAAGLRVHRADPWMLPARPEFGSVAAAALAMSARGNPAGLVPLVRERGTQTGREQELEDGYSVTAAALRRLTQSGRSLSHGRGDVREIALTFDDGPQPAYTEPVLDVLARYGVPATFFCVGLHARGHTETLARMREEGHTVGNHTWSHPFLPELSRAELSAQLDRTEEVLAPARGAAPMLFRPPYGARSPQVLDWLEAMELTTVLWDVAPDDWTMPGADYIARTVLDQAEPGSIVLLHDGGGDRSQTLEALPRIIEGLLERGYRFTAVDRMASAHNAGSVEGSA